MCLLHFYLFWRISLTSINYRFQIPQRITLHILSVPGWSCRCKRSLDVERSVCEWNKRADYEGARKKWQICTLRLVLNRSIDSGHHPAVVARLLRVRARLIRAWCYFSAGGLPERVRRPERVHRGWIAVARGVYSRGQFLWLENIGGATPERRWLSRSPGHRGKTISSCATPK